MNILRIGISVGYSVGQLALGLLLHPYQTMQQLLEDKVFIWMALVPTGALGIVMVLWRFVVVPVVQGVFSCSEGLGADVVAGAGAVVGGGGGLASWVAGLGGGGVLTGGLLTLCGLLPFFADWLILFCIYWQVLLLYLLLRFHLVFQKS